jgi:hypothetical protein
MTLSKLLFIAAFSMILSTGSAFAGLQVPPADPQEDDFDLDTIEDNSVYTSHHSTINPQGLDTALIGTWQLSRVFLDLPQLQRAFPTKGRTLTITADGHFSEDYSTAHFTDEAAGANAPLPHGLKSCAETAEFSGSSSGIMQVEAYYDLDVEPSDEDDRVRFSLFVRRNTGVRPKIVCPGSSANAMTTAVSPPLGTGRADPTPEGPRLFYTYSISEDWKTLEMATTRQPHLRYTFVRLSF